MRSGVAPVVSSNRDSGVTTDLLSEWTDPDTAMEAVGNTLGVFPDGASPVRALRDDATLRDSLDAVLHRMIDGGALETRARADGRSAFRWRADLGPVSRDTAYGLVATHAQAPAAAAPPVAAKPASELEAVDFEPPSFWMRMFLQTAPLLLPAVSCVLALLAFLWLDQGVALLVTALLAVIGVVGIVRRVQLATFWMIGLLIAGLLVRFS
jgi:hypothetical protein